MKTPPATAMAASASTIDEATSTSTNFFARAVRGVWNLVPTWRPQIRPMFDFTDDYFDEFPTAVSRQGGDDWHEHGLREDINSLSLPKKSLPYRVARPVTERLSTSRAALLLLAGPGLGGALGLIDNPVSSLPPSPQIGARDGLQQDRDATMLLEVGCARPGPSSVPRMIGGTATAEGGMLRFDDPDEHCEWGWPDSGELGDTGQGWRFGFPSIFPGADAAMPPQDMAPSMVDHLPSAEANGDRFSRGTGRSVTAPTGYIDTRGDLRILHDALRAHQSLLQRSNQLIGPVNAERIFVPVGMHSPIAEYVADMAPVLTHLKLRAASNDDLPDIYDAMGISAAGIDQLRTHRSFRKLNLTKPMDVEFFFDASMPCLMFNGTDLRNNSVLADIRGPQALLLTAYVSKIQHVLSESSYRASAPGKPDSTSLKKIVVRDDGQVSLQSMLKFYGVALPDMVGPTDVENAIRDLRPKAVLISSSGDRKLPAMDASLLIDATNPPLPMVMAFDEHETDDYGVISREIKVACTQARDVYLGKWTKSHGDSADSLLLKGLKKSGGISIELEIDDTDGVDNMYFEKHSVNPRSATTLEQYFDQAADLLGDYMIRKIRDNDGEDEGAINIARLQLRLFVPHFVAHDVSLTSDEVRIFDVRSSRPPFLYIDAGLMTTEASQAVSKAIGEITAELRVSKGVVSKSPKLLAAVNRAMELSGELSAGSSDRQSRAFVSRAFDRVLTTYYRISSEIIKKQQRLLIAQQPTEKEFLSRAICRQLGIDEFNWPVMMGRRIPFRYQVGLANRGSFIGNDVTVSKTMLELVYDETLRKEIGLASDKEDASASAAQSIAEACLIACDVEEVTSRIGAFFNAFSVLGLVGGVSNTPLPEELVHAGTSFAAANGQYIDQAVDTFEELEAERLVLTSDTVLPRLDEARELAKGDRAHSSPINFKALLSNDERTQLDDRVEKFRSFLSVRRNTDGFHDLQPEWSQALAQLKDITLEICRNAPLQVCMAVNLVDDIAQGEDAKTIAMDGLFYLSSRLGGLRNPLWRRLTALGHVGANAWAFEQSIEVYNRAVKDGNYDLANKSLTGIIQSGHSLLASGASVVERAYGSMSRQQLRDALNHAEGEGLDSGDASHTVPVGAQVADRYWSVDGRGVFSRESLGREVLSPLWNGDLLVDGGARAISLNNDVATVYMLGDTPCQPIRAPSGALELWPVRDLALAEDSWVRTIDPSKASYSRSGLPEFPQTFSGPAGGQTGAGHDAVAWFDNHVSVFEPIQAQHLDVEGHLIGSSQVNIGVLEHKYVIDQDGVIQTLEHGGTRNGKTQFIRNDGSTLVVDRSIAAWPRYKPKVKATVVGSQGMFAVVEVSGSVDGLANKRRVSGAVAARKSGGHELVLELDAGVYYKGDIPEVVALPLSPDSSGSGLVSFELDMQKIPAAADPKCASAALWHSRGAYRDGGVAEGEFALELLFGSKLANRAYSNNYRWVQEQHELIESARLALPPDVRDTESLYYELSTSPADAILFAPRNRAVLADTLIASNVGWGPLSSMGDIELVEEFLRNVQVNDAGGQSGATAARSPLLGPGERIPVDASKRSTIYEQLKERTRNNNLVLAEVETQEGRKIQFVGLHAADAAELIVMGDEVDAQSRATASSLGLTIKAGDKKIHAVGTGSVVRQIQSEYPNPADIRSILIFSLDTASHRLAEEIFTSSVSGYRYRSVLRFREQTENAPSVSPGRNDLPDAGLIRPALVDVRIATLVPEGIQKGAYTIGEDYYVPLGTDGMYRAAWDSQSTGFRLLPEGHGHQPTENLPLVRRVKGEFRLTNSPIGTTGKVALSPADRLRLQEELEKNPIPPVLRTIRQHGTDVVLVANPGQVSEKLTLDGHWVLTVSDIEYGPAITETGALVYVREDSAEAMGPVCGPRSLRALEPLCLARAGNYIESRNAVKDVDLPAEGTDVPDTEDWTLWASDTRVYGATLASLAKAPAWAVKENLKLFPYEGKYCRIKAGKENTSPLKATELRELGLPEKVTYAQSVEAKLMYRKGHGAKLRIENFETHLPDSKMEVGASIFKMKVGDTEWCVAHYDGAWYQGHFERPIGQGTPASISMTKMAPKEELSAREKDLQRYHAGMQSANYHAKTTGIEKLKEIMERNRKLGLSSPEFDASDHFAISTTADLAFLFDRDTRENVQVRARNEAKWHWLKLDEITPDTDAKVISSGDDMLKAAKVVFDDQTIIGIDDLLRVSHDKKLSIGTKNFLFVRENGGDFYFSVSGRPNEKFTPPVFKDTDRVEMDLNGKKVNIVYIDKDPNLDKYLEALDNSDDYPRALPVAARPDQLSDASIVFDVTTSHERDTERKMIAYLTQGGVPGRTSTDSVEVLNRNNACKSCASVMQQYFTPFKEVIHFYGKDYPK